MKLTIAGDPPEEVTVPEGMIAFARRLCALGRTDKEVLAVAQATAWNSQRRVLAELLKLHGGDRPPMSVGNG